MKNTTNKIVLIGAGAVGTSFLYSAINQGLAERYGIIDINEVNSRGQKLDLEDARPALPRDFEVESGNYELVSDADLIIITAGRPQKPGETRLNMVADNARIMKQIALQVKSHGFKGVTIIASNPVDIMTTVYQKITGFEPKKVISSSCTLDTLRLKLELSKIFNVAPTEFGVFVMGEHGDSSVSTFAHGTLKGIPLSKFFAKHSITQDQINEIHERVWKKAYEIIDCKHATFYGIGASLTDISMSILRDEKRVFATGSLLNGEYDMYGTYAGIPCVIGKEGIVETYEFPLSEQELAKFKKSVNTLKENTLLALKAIK
ncbi:MAG: L-lactate dehydrogenase [Mycoplasmataceae bacterium]|nr:L-lactate dehydrogenase [Mycoplasmataceae bacterium]